MKGSVILPALCRGVSPGCFLYAYARATASLTCCATQQRVCCSFGSVVSRPVSWLLDVSCVWMSSRMFLCQPTVGRHDALITYIICLFEAKGCGKRHVLAAGTMDDTLLICGDQIIQIPIYRIHDEMWDSLPTNIVNIKHHQVAVSLSIIKNQTSHVLHINLHIL